MTIKCAKWCGRGCTEEEYNDAVRRADQLVEHLGGMGGRWVPRVMENMGWHSSVVSASGTVKVNVHTYNGKSSYTAFVGSADTPGGQWAEHGDTPKGAVAAVIAKAKVNVKMVTSWLEGF